MVLSTNSFANNLLTEYHISSSGANGDFYAKLLSGHNIIAECGNGRDREGNSRSGCKKYASLLKADRIYVDFWLPKWDRNGNFRCHWTQPICHFTCEVINFELYNSTSININIDEGLNKCFISTKRYDKCDIPAGRFVDWINCNKTGLNLRNANLEVAKLSGTIFTGADLRGANLAGAEINISTKFEGAKLGGATWIDGKTVCAEGSISKCSVSNPGVTLIAVNSLKTQRFNLKYFSGTRNISETAEANSHKIISLPVLEKPLGTASVTNQEPLCQKPIEKSGVYWFVIALGNDNNPKCITDYSAFYTTDDLKPHIVEAYNETRMTPMILEYQIDDNQQKYTMAKTDPITVGGSDGFDVAYTPKNAILVVKRLDGQVICTKSVPDIDKYKKFYQIRLINHNTCTFYSHD